MSDYIDEYREADKGTEEERTRAWEAFLKEAKLDIARAKLKGLIK